MFLYIFHTQMIGMLRDNDFSSDGKSEIIETAGLPPPPSVLFEALVKRKLVEPHPRRFTLLWFLQAAEL
jgi:hypothetical protein